MMTSSKLLTRITRVLLVVFLLMLTAVPLYAAEEVAEAEGEVVAAGASNIMLVLGFGAIIIIGFAMWQRGNLTRES